MTRLVAARLLFVVTVAARAEDVGILMLVPRSVVPDRAVSDR